MSNKTKIYLFRHGETEWNVQGRRQGRLDSPLTQKGRLQARSNADRLARIERVDGETAVFVSPLGRARQTALILLESLGITESQIVYEPRLRECSFGRWEGLTDAEIAAQDPVAWQAREADLWNVAAPEGESYGDVQARLAHWFDEVALSETNLVVSHGLTSRVFRGLYGGLPRDGVSRLAQPQEGFYKLEDGIISFVD